MSIVIRCLSLRIKMSDSPACASLLLMCSRILMSSIRYAGNSLVPVYQFDFQSWMTPTRIPPGWTFCPILGLRLLGLARRRFGEHDGDVARGLVDPDRAPARAGAPALHHGALVDVRRRDDQ